MTTPAQPATTPRHARRRAAPAAAARNRQAAQAAKTAPKPKTAPKGGTPQATAALYAGEKAGQAARSAGRAAAQARITPGDRGYQPVLLAEFLAAAAVVVLVPVATGGSDTAKAKGGVSPYAAGDLTQLVAIGAVYFVLALASSGNSGRLSAWLGGLVLLAVLMGKLAHGNLSAVFNAVTPAKDQGAGGKAGDIAGSVLLWDCGR